MVQIPQYVQQVGLEAPNRDIPNVNTQVDDSIGRGLMQLGNTLSNLGQAAQARKDKMDEFNTRVQWDAFQERQSQYLTELERNATGDGRGVHDSFMKWRADEGSKFLGGIQNPQLKQRYGTMLSSSDAEHWSNQSANAEWKIGNGYTVTEITTASEKAKLGIAQNPGSYDAQMKDMEERIRTAPNLTPEQRNKMLEDLRTEGPKFLAAGVEQSDPEAFRYLMGLGTHEERIGFLTKRVIQAESSWDPDAVSRTGATGLMQVQPDSGGLEVARKIGDTAYQKMSTAERTEFLKNPDNNLRYGQVYLGMMVERYNGDVEAALVAYNAGPGNADKWLEAGRDYSALPKPEETQPYVNKVLGNMGPAKYVSGGVDPGQTGANRDLKFWSDRYQGKRAMHADMNPEFANRLQTAIIAAEKATGTKASINSLSRTNAEQQEAYRNYKLTGGLAARPAGMIDPRTGKPAPGSRHERGMAADIARGPVLDWLHQHAEEYGLEFLKGTAFAKDPVHIQLKLDGKGNQAPVRVADASGTGGISMNDASPSYADGVPGGGMPRSGFVSPVFEGMSAADYLKVQHEAATGYTKAAQAQLAQDTADQILAQAGATADEAGNQRAAQTAVDAIGDATVQKGVQALVDSHFTRWQQITKDEQDRNYNETYAQVDELLGQNKPADAIALVTRSKLSPEDQDKLRTRIAKGGVQYDDPAVVGTLDAMRFSDPNVFAGQNLRRTYGSQLTNATITAYEEKQAAIKKANASKDTAEANMVLATGEKAKSIIDRYFAETGIETKKDKMTEADAKHTNFVYATVQRELEVAQQGSKTPLTLTQITDVVETVMKTYPRFKPVESSWMPWRAADADVSMGEVLDAYDSAKLNIDQAADALRRAGKPVNAATLQQTLDDYLAVKNGGQ